MNCTVFREMLDPYLEEGLEDDQRSWFRDHLRRCDSCRGWAVGEEPSLLFVAADPPVVDPARIEACAAAVTNQIRQQRLEGRIRGRRRPWLAAAAAAVMVIGGGLAWRMVPFWGSDSVVPVAVVKPEAEIPHTPPSIEVEMSGEDVRVYQFATEDHDTAAVFVVNPALEL